jgi:hypothetical protein
MSRMETSYFHPSLNQLQPIKCSFAVHHPVADSID